MAKEPLKVGDRVRVYDVCKETQLLTSDTGTLRAIRPSGALFVAFNNWGFTSDTVWHPRQVVRLVKKPRREFWIEPGLPEMTGHCGLYKVCQQPREGYLHVREVRPARGKER
jgi:hypothetical protein